MNVRSGNVDLDKRARPRRSRAVSGRARTVAGATRADEPRRGRGRPLVDDKRRIILDAALRTFAARGYHGTAVPEVADAAGVGTGTLYRYFENKEALVNEVYRDAKLRLKTAVLDGMPAPDVYELDNAQRWFAELWRRLAAFARAEPEAFRFLELQDHVEYLDAESRALELTVLGPLWLAGKRLRDRSGGPPVDIAIALLWGAFVGVVKASRLGYLRLDDKLLEQAGAAAWRVVAPDVSRTREVLASQPRTREVPASQPRTREVPASQPRTREVPASQPRTREVPASQPRTREVLASQPRTREVPASQPRTRESTTGESATGDSPAGKSPAGESRKRRTKG